MARYDKYDPIHGGFRAAVAVAYPDTDLGAAWGCGINSAGQVVKGAGQTGVVGVMVVTQKPGRVGPSSEVRVIDIMKAGCITDFGPSGGSNVPGVDYGMAGTSYYSDNYGSITSSPFGPQVQLVTITGSPTGGTFTLSYGGQTTSGLAYNISAANLLTALEDLSTVGSGNVTVTLSSSVYTVTFVSSLAPQTPQIASPTLLTAAASLSGGTSPGVTITNASPSTWVGFTVEPDRLQVDVEPNVNPSGSTVAESVDVGQVQSLSASAGSPSYSVVDLSWTALSGATAYVVQVQNVSNDTGQWDSVWPANGGQPTTNSTTVIDLGSDTEYEFQVAAVVNGVLGPFSASASITTAAYPND